MTQTTINFQGLKNLATLMNNTTINEKPELHTYTFKYHYVACNNIFSTTIVAENDKEAMSEAKYFMMKANIKSAEKHLRKAGNYIESVFVENSSCKTIGVVKI